MEIVKVQRPIFASDGSDIGLVYDSKRSLITQHVLLPDTLQAMGEDFKAFFEAKRSSCKWLIGRRVADEAW